MEKTQLQKSHATVPLTNLLPNFRSFPQSSYFFVVLYYYCTIHPVLFYVLYYLLGKLYLQGFIMQILNPLET